PGAHAFAQRQRHQPHGRRGRRTGDSRDAATARRILRRRGDVHMTELPVALIGMGKMGRALASLAPERGFRVVATLDPAQSGFRGVTAGALSGAQVAIEFTTPDAAPDNARACAAAGCPVVVGTTGWYDRLDEVSADGQRRGGAM